KTAKPRRMPAWSMSWQRFRHKRYRPNAIRVHARAVNALEAMYVHFSDSDHGPQCPRVTKPVAKPVASTRSEIQARDMGRSCDHRGSRRFGGSDAFDLTLSTSRTKPGRGGVAVASPQSIRRRC